jgi:ABC-2 type transport system ATP-binding protein
LSHPYDGAVTNVDPNLAIYCKGLVKRFEDVTAVDGVDLSITKGECFGLLGPNGAGKTTCIEILEGLTKADEGEAVILGKSWGTGRDTDIRRRIGVQLQDNQIADKLTAKEVIRLFRSFYDRGIEVDAALQLLELSAKQNTRYHKLSGGQKQRLSLACALVHAPDLLFLDEPTTGLDPQARVKVWDIVEHFLENGGTVMLTTHYMEEAAKLCTRLAIMDHGKLIASGSPKELIDGLGATEVIEYHLDRPDPDDSLDTIMGVVSWFRRSEEFVVKTRSISDTLPMLLKHIEGRRRNIASLRTHRATLDDVFLEHTGRGLRDV